VSAQPEHRMPIVHIQPLRSLDKGLATKREQESWTPRQRIIRTCQHCNRAYTNGGYVWSCEHYHEGLT
jgi:hypothetical protein